MVKTGAKSRRFSEIFCSGVVDTDRMTGELDALVVELL